MVRGCMIPSGAPRGRWWDDDYSEIGEVLVSDGVGVLADLLEAVVDARKQNGNYPCVCLRFSNTRILCSHPACRE